MYLEFATFIPITFIVLVQIFILAIKIIGPIPAPEFNDKVVAEIDAVESSEKNHDGRTKSIQKTPGIGLFYFGLNFGAYIIIFEIINLISLALKPQGQMFEPAWLSPLLYLIHSNRLFYTIITFALAIWFTLGIFVSISKLQITIYACGIFSLAIYLISLTSKDNSDAMVFLESSIIALFVVSIVFWLILLILNKVLANSYQKGNKNAKSWIVPIYTAPKSFVKVVTGARYEFIVFLITWLMFLMSWADIPIF